MTSAAQASNDDLARYCAEETEKFYRKLLSDSQYCLELFRRALVDELSEALTYVYRIYERQTLVWVQRHGRFDKTGESPEYFALLALNNFYFALRGEQFHRFPSLSHLLSYLKTCVNTAIVQYLRDQKPQQTLPLSPLHASDPDPQLTEAHIGEVWARICELVPDANEQLLARCAFLLDMKPRHIVAAYPQRWSSVREVSVALYAIRQTLRHDKVLRALLGPGDLADEVNG